MNNRLFRNKNQDNDKKNISPKQKVYDNKDTIKAQLRNLKNLDSKVYARYLVTTDPIQGKIPKDEIDEIINSSMKCGKDEANKLLEKYGNISPSEMAKSLNIDLSHQDKQGLTDYIYFGLFESPNSIIIYDGNIETADNLLKELNIDYFNVDFKDIVLAHEIFHYIEFHDKSLYSNIRRINLWSLGKLYTHTSPLICTGEIAGMSFAKILIDLDFDPNLLNYIFLVAYDFDKADKLYKRITKYA